LNRTRICQTTRSHDPGAAIFFKNPVLRGDFYGNFLWCRKRREGYEKIANAIFESEKIVTTIFELGGCGIFYDSRKDPVNFLAAFYPVKDDPVFCGYLTSDAVVSRTNAVVMSITAHFVDVKIVKDVFRCGYIVKHQTLDPGTIAFGQRCQIF
jgi:hypothetical protein